MSVTLFSAMPKKVAASSAFGERLYQLRRQRGITQAHLAQLIGSSQRAVSHYETIATYPPAPLIIELARALQVSTDELLGLRRTHFEEEQSPDVRRLWKNFQKVISLPEKDRRAVIRLINSLGTAKQN